LQTVLYSFILCSWLVNEVRIGITSADEFKDKKEVNDFTSEDIKWKISVK